MSFRISTVLVFAVLAGARSAAAADRVKLDTKTSESSSDWRRGPERGMNNSISLLGSLGYAYSAGTGFGLSGRYQYTVNDEGILSDTSLPDDLGVELGADYQHYSWSYYSLDWSYNEFRISGSAVWNLWFSDRFAAYPRLGLGFAFGSWSSNLGYSHPGGYGGLYLVGGAGVLYELDSITLRAEATNSSLQLGAALSL